MYFLVLGVLGLIATSILSIVSDCSSASMTDCIMGLLSTFISGFSSSKSILVPFPPAITSAVTIVFRIPYFLVMYIRFVFDLI